MKGKIISSAEQEMETVDMGEMGWITRPSSVGCKQLTTIVVTVHAGKGHSFHKHPNQEETIYIVSGEIEQWIEDEKSMLYAGDTAYLAAGVVHASFNVSDQPTKILVSLGPCVGEDGYEVVEMADQPPWNGLRAGQ